MEHSSFAAPLAVREPAGERQDALGAAPRALHGADSDHARAGDFATIYRQYVTPVYRYLYLQVGNPHDAEDLTATTFSRALTTIHRYEEQGNFAAWLFSIARHTLRDYQRRQRPRVAVDAMAAA